MFCPKVNRELHGECVVSVHGERVCMVSRGFKFSRRSDLVLGFAFLFPSMSLSW